MKPERIQEPTEAQPLWHTLEGTPTLSWTFTFNDAVEALVLLQVITHEAIARQSPLDLAIRGAEVHLTLPTPEGSGVAFDLADIVDLID